MKASACSRRARGRIPAETRRDLAQNAGFACSICGSIPIVFHHIEEWARAHSDDEAFLIPICDKCHRRIHGEGGSIFSKDQLRHYKSHPMRPDILRDHIPLEGQGGYSFFVGGNFAAHAERAALFGQPGGYPLLSIDTTGGILRLSLLAGVAEGAEQYLIRDNELLLPRAGVLDMTYSGSALTVWKTAFGKKAVLIDLLIKPEAIIIKQMNTTFNGVPFRVHRFRVPQGRQVAKLSAKIVECEELYRQQEAEIDACPTHYGARDGIDYDLVVANTRKDGVRTDIERWLLYDFCHAFRWTWPYYCFALGRLLAQSPVFGKGAGEVPLPPELQALEQVVSDARAKYRQEFADLQDVVVEYGGTVWSGNVSM